MFLDKNMIDSIKAFKLLYELSGKDLSLIHNVYIDTQCHQWEQMYDFIYSKVFDTININFDIELHPETEDLWYLTFKSRTYKTYKDLLSKANSIKKSSPYLYNSFDIIFNNRLLSIKDLFYDLEGAIKLEDCIEEKEIVGFKILCEFLDTPDKLIYFICRYIQMQKEIICIIKSINRKY